MTDLKKPNDGVEESAGTISLKDYKQTFGGISDFGRDIINCIGADILSFERWDQFILRSLMSIEEIIPLVKGKISRIEIGSATVLQHFKVHEQVFLPNIDKLKLDGLNSLKATKRFFYTFLGFHEFPKYTLEELEPAVRFHLQEISALINKYESDAYIQSFIDDDQGPHNDLERMKLAFYKRCRKERDKILNYYLFGMEERAITKARGSLLGFSFSRHFGLTHVLYDYPYSFGLPGNIELFDYEQIDRIGHRVLNFPFNDYEPLKALYATDKLAFYSTYFKKNDPDTLFHEMNNRLALLSTIKDRRPFFDRLKELFKAKDWISFYALALPQIEGVFSDMLSTSNDPKGKSMLALPAKVAVLRYYHRHNNISYFDYYQYIIPQLRNKFMHIGYDEEFESKCYDLLTDLHHLLNLFAEMELPLVKILLLHSRKQLENFASHNQFANYFQLLDSLSSDQKKQYHDQIASFERDFLVGHCEANQVCSEVVLQTSSKIDALISAFKGFAGHDLSSRLRTMPPSELEVRLKKDLELCRKVSDVILHRKDLVIEVQALDAFYRGVKLHLPSLPEETLITMDNMYRTEKKMFMNLTKTIQAANRLEEDADL